jgi:GAF domain-containing protein
MFNTTQFINQAIVAISTHAPEAFSSEQVVRLERLAFEISVALQERKLAQERAEDAQCEEFENEVIGHSDSIDIFLSHAHGWNS